VLPLNAKTVSVARGRQPAKATLVIEATCAHLMHHVVQRVAKAASAVKKRQFVPTSNVDQACCSNLVTTMMTMIMMTVGKTSMVVGPQSAQRTSAARRRLFALTIDVTKALSGCLIKHVVPKDARILNAVQRKQSVKTIRVLQGSSAQRVAHVVQQHVLISSVVSLKLHAMVTSATEVGL